MYIAFDFNNVSIYVNYHIAIDLNVVREFTKFIKKKYPYGINKKSFNDKEQSVIGEYSMYVYSLIKEQNMVILKEIIKKTER